MAILLTNEEIVIIEDKHFGEGSGTGIADKCQFDICKAQLRKVADAIDSMAADGWYLDDIVGAIRKEVK